MQTPEDVYNDLLACLQVRSTVSIPEEAKTEFCDLIAGELLYCRDAPQRFDTAKISDEIIFASIIFASLVFVPLFPLNAIISLFIASWAFCYPLITYTHMWRHLEKPAAKIHIPIPAIQQIMAGVNVHLYRIADRALVPSAGFVPRDLCMPGYISTRVHTALPQVSQLDALQAELEIRTFMMDEFYIARVKGLTQNICRMCVRLFFVGIGASYLAYALCPAGYEYWASIAIYCILCVTAVLSQDYDDASIGRYLCVIQVPGSLRGYRNEQTTPAVEILYGKYIRIIPNHPIVQG